MWFTTGIAPVIARNHRVVAIDNRNHGQSDKPQPGGSGRADDVIELMDYLKIDKAHIHGYSMGGGFVGQLLGKIPQRFITAGFGGSGMTETDADLRAKATALDEALPKATGADAEAMDRFRGRVSAARTDGRLGPPAGGAPSTSSTASTSGTSTSGPARPAPAPAPSGPTVDLTKLTIPVMGINGAFDGPYSKTMRLYRELKVFHNVVLPGKTHLTAIGVGGPMPKQYIDEISHFIDANDVP
jgi:pimeloyl-ACP methyl ester carboxylesterase